jgi:dihydroneopterin aldolase
MDKIFLHALKAETIVGIYDWERQVRQTVFVDLEMSANVRQAALSDAIGDTLNYKRVAKRVLGFIEASQYHLVETLTEQVAMLLLAEFQLAWVRVALSKPGAVRSSRDVGVIVERGLSDLEEWRRLTAAKV